MSDTQYRDRVRPIVDEINAICLKIDALQAEICALQEKRNRCVDRMVAVTTGSPIKTLSTTRKPRRDRLMMSLHKQNVLHAIDRGGPDGVKSADIVKETGASTPSVYRAINLLVKDGVIERTGSFHYRHTGRR